MNAAVLDAPAAPRAAPAFDAKGVVIGGAVALIAWLALVPLGFLLWESFLTPESAGRAQQFTLENYIAAYTGAETFKLLFNSLQFAFGSSVLAFVIGTFFAWVNERTNTPFKALFFALSVICLLYTSPSPRD